MKRLLLILISFFGSLQLFAAAEPETKTVTLYGCETIKFDTDSMNISLPLGYLTVKKDDKISDLIQKIQTGDFNLRLEGFPDLDLQPGCFAVQSLSFDTYFEPRRWHRCTIVDFNLTVQSTGLWNASGGDIYINSPEKELTVQCVFGRVNQKTIKIKSTLSTEGLSREIKQEFGIEINTKIDMLYKGEAITPNLTIFIGNILGLWEDADPIIHFVIRPD